MSRNGGRLGPTASPFTGGVWTLGQQYQLNRDSLWKDPNGLSAATAANSAKDILAAYPSSPTGVYWIKINGVPTQVYCDMTNNGGGWMLYSSFGTGNPLDATTAPAISGNRININTLAANGWTTGTSDGSQYYYGDGTNNNTGYFINESDNTSWFFFFASSTPPYGFLYLNTFKLATPVVSEMRIRFGDPTNNASTGNEVYTNGTLRVTNSSKVQTSVIPYTPNTTAGANSMYMREMSINGISWLYVR